MKLTTEVDFIKFYSWAFFIEIALNICALRLGPTFKQQKAAQKLGATLYNVRPTFMESTPGCAMNSYHLLGCQLIKRVPFFQWKVNNFAACWCAFFMVLRPTNIFSKQKYFWLFFCTISPQVLSTYSISPLFLFSSLSIHFSYFSNDAFNFSSFYWDKIAKQMSKLKLNNTVFF